MSKESIIFIIPYLFIIILLISLIFFIIEITIKSKVIIDYENFIRIINCTYSDRNKLDIKENLEKLMEESRYKRIEDSIDENSKLKNYNSNQIEDLRNNTRCNSMINFNKSLHITSNINNFNNENNTNEEKGKFIDVVL
ncbi:hypothetical protein [Clostridium sp.]|uniref:hypothetical protein n=1 Tax=Clostridium sp. TaxID=1506 RepID=UPI0025BEA63C|nr:hypothetical protein [Clostridium sp.]